MLATEMNVDDVIAQYGFQFENALFGKNGSRRKLVKITTHYVGYVVRLSREELWDRQFMCYLKYENFHKTILFHLYLSQMLIEKASIINLAQTLFINVPTN